MSQNVAITDLESVQGPQSAVVDSAKLVGRAENEALTRLQYILSKSNKDNSGGTDWCADVRKNLAAPIADMTEDARSISQGMESQSNFIGQAATAAHQAEADSASALQQEQTIDAEYAAAGLSGSAAEDQYNSEVSGELNQLSRYGA